MVESRGRGGGVKEVGVVGIKEVGVVGIKE